MRRVQPEIIDQIFCAIGHPVRRAILETLAEGDATVGALAVPHHVSPPAISQHLRVLEHAGLVTQSKDGRVRRCRLNPAPLSDAFGWLLRYRVFWEDAIDELQQQVEGDTK